MATLSNLAGGAEACGRSTGTREMAAKTYLIRFKNPAISTQPLVAHRAEIQRDHIVMFDAEGRVVGLFSLAIVESWSEIPHRTAF